MAQPELTFDPDEPASGDGLYGLPHTVDEAAVVVVPVPFDATTSYRRGTAAAPPAILEASAQVDLHDLETGAPWKAGIAMQEEDPRFAAWNEQVEADALAIIEAGGVGDDPALHACAARVNAVSEAVNAAVEAKIEAIFASGQIPAVLGGDHSVPFGAMRAAARRHPGLGVLHIDAHADLRDAYEGFAFSHASIFHNVLTRIPEVGRLVQVGIRDCGTKEIAFAQSQGSRVHLHDDLAIGAALAEGTPWAAWCEQAIAPLPDKVWISFDIDGLDPTLCPSTGTPVPGGLSWREALTLLAVLGRSGREIVGFDLCEVNPGTEWDCNVGARLLYKLAGWCIASRGQGRA